VKLPAFGQEVGRLPAHLQGLFNGRIAMRIIGFALIFATAIGLAGCGSDPGTRAVTGGLMGAGAGAGVSALTGGRPATGALIGGGIGAVGGAVTH
jgi:osmotically inducible lipoprotein OsmB